MSAVILLIYLRRERIVFRGDKVPLFAEPLDTLTHLKYNLPVFRTAHTHI